MAQKLDLPYRPLYSAQSIEPALFFHDIHLAPCSSRFAGLLDHFGALWAVFEERETTELQPSEPPESKDAEQSKVIQYHTEITRYHLRWTRALLLVVIFVGSAGLLPLLAYWARAFSLYHAKRNPSLHTELCNLNPLDNTSLVPQPTKDVFTLASYNVGFLPRPFACSLNDDLLAPNSERATEIASYFNTWHQNQRPPETTINGLSISKTAPDILCLQEAFDPDAVGILSQHLKAVYPYQMGVNTPLPFGLHNSGLVILSKYPILEGEFIRFDNMMLGEETLGGKGFMALKVAVGGDRFMSLYNTHLHAGGAIFREISVAHAGSTSARRGEEMGLIAQHMEHWGKAPPATAAQYQHLGTILCGDLNTKLNDRARMLGISQGSSRENGCRAGDIKYTGQARLFANLSCTTPENVVPHIDKLVTRNDDTGDITEVKRTINTTQAEHARKQGYFGGTVFTHAALHTKRQQPNLQLTDAATAVAGAQLTFFDATCGKNTIDTVQMVTEPEKPQQLTLRSAALGVNMCSDHALLYGECRTARPTGS